MSRVTRRRERGVLRLANCRLIIAFLSLLFGPVLGPSGGSSAGRLGGTFWGLLLEIVGVFSPIVNPNNPSKQPLNCPLDGPQRRDAISREFATPSLGGGGRGATDAAPAGPRAPAAGLRATRYIGLLDKKRLLDKPGD